MGCVSTKPEDSGGNRKAGANSEEVNAKLLICLEIQEYGAEKGNQVCQ